jgi:hypothetical protein
MTYLSNGLQIHVQSVVTADLTLKVGGATQTITVTPEGTMLQAEDASLGQTISSESMNDLPLNGRNWISLATLATGSYLTGGTQHHQSLRQRRRARTGRLPRQRRQQ